MEDMTQYLGATRTIDVGSKPIRDTSAALIEGCSSDAEKAVRLFYFVRDQIPYSIYMISMFEEDFVASTVLERGKGYCVQKTTVAAPKILASFSAWMRSLFPSPRSRYSG